MLLLSPQGITLCSVCSQFIKYIYIYIITKTTLEVEEDCKWSVLHNKIEWSWLKYLLGIYSTLIDQSMYSIAWIYWNEHLISPQVCTQCNLLLSTVHGSITLPCSCNSWANVYWKIWIFFQHSFMTPWHKLWEEVRVPACWAVNLSMSPPLHLFCIWRQQTRLI